MQFFKKINSGQSLRFTTIYYQKTSMIQKFCVEKNHFLQKEFLPIPHTAVKKKWKEKIRAKIYCYAIFLLTLHNNEKISSVRALFHGVIHWQHTSLLSVNEWVLNFSGIWCLLTDILKIFPFPIFVYLLFYYIHNGLVYSFYSVCVLQYCHCFFHVLIILYLAYVNYFKMASF